MKIFVALFAALAVGATAAPSETMVPVSHDPALNVISEGPESRTARQLVEKLPVNENPTNRQFSPDNYSIPNDGNIYLIPLPSLSNSRTLYTLQAQFTCPAGTNMRMECQTRLRLDDAYSSLKTGTSSSNLNVDWYSFTSGESQAYGYFFWDVTGNTFFLDLKYHRRNSRRAYRYSPRIEPADYCTVECTAGSGVTTTTTTTTTADPGPTDAATTTTTEAATTAAPDACPCVREGDQSSCTSRVLNGDNTCAEAMPHQCALYWYNSRSAFTCGCTIISDEWILTAAHCVDGDSSNWVGIGVTNRDQSDLFIQSSDIVMHEDYSSRTLNNDIALVKLSQKLTWTNRIRPACLNTLSNVELEGELLTVSGLGKTNSNNGVPSVNQIATATVMPDSYCSFVNGYNANFMCVLDQNSSDQEQVICSGDSGGPLTRFVSSNQLCVAGATSWTLSSNDCERAGVAGYTEVYRYLDWISDNSQITPNANCNC